MIVDQTVDSRQRSRTHWFTQRLLPVGALAIAVLFVHGWSLGDGLSLDDHWHYQHLRHADVRVESLFSATTIDVDDLADHWWRDKLVRFKYARPLSVAVKWLACAAGGWNPAAVHLVSLLLHWISAVLIWRLCLRFGAVRRTAFWGALFFTCLPLTVFAVDWLAAQNMLLMTALMLGAVLAYLNAMNWHCDASSPEEQPTNTQTGWMILAYGLWVAAMMSRENAVVLPAVLLALDWAGGGRRLVRSRWRWHALWWATAAIYVVWRIGFYAVAMPDGYVRRLGDDGFLLFCAAKLIFYWACSVWPAPMVIGPSGRYHPLTDAPLDYAAMAVIAIVAVVVYTMLVRRTRGWWVWPLWTVLATLPVTTVMATPHSGYLCGVAAALGATIIASTLAKRAGRRGRTTIAIAMVLTLVGSTGLCKLHRLMWRGMHYAESFVFAGLAADPPPAGAHVFIINLPFAATYARIWMSESLDREIPPDRLSVLTYAPSITRADADCTIERIDSKTIRIRTDGRGWFSGFLGQFLIDGMRQSGGFIPGETIETDAFTATVVEMTDDGVTAIDFAFARPLDDPAYAFYLTSEQCGALRLRFDASPAAKAAEDQSRNRAVTLRDMERATRGLRQGNANAAAVLFAGALDNDPSLGTDAFFMLKETVAIVAEATAAKIQHLFERESLTDDEIRLIQSWWAGSGIDRNSLESIFAGRNRLMDIRERRDELVRGRRLIGRYIQSDLYLTGAPFPSPRGLVRPDQAD